MAVGEALGAPLEGMSPEDIERRVGPIERFLDPQETQPEYRSGYFTRSAYEDETQVALATIDTLLEEGEFAVAGLRARLEALGEAAEGRVLGQYRRPRRNFRIALRRMLSGGPWETCGVNTAGSGAASRGIPLGVWYRDDAEGRTRAAIESTLLTHRDPRACASTASVAEAVALAVAADRPEALSPEDLATCLAAAARRAEDMMAEEYVEVLYPGHETFLNQFSVALQPLPDLIQLDLEPAFRRIIDQASDKGARPITTATGGFSLTAVVSSLYLWLTGLDSYEGCVLDAISEGGSADTLGCLVGGLSGALHGVDAIPKAWRGDLKNGDHVDAYGTALARDPEPGPRREDLVAAEARVTPPAPLPARKKRVRRPASRGPGGGGAGGGKRPAQGRGGGRGPRRDSGGRDGGARSSRDSERRDGPRKGGERSSDRSRGGAGRGSRGGGSAGSRSDRGGGRSSAKGPRRPGRGDGGGVG